jgi:hypothetical protein
LNKECDGKGGQTLAEAETERHHDGRRQEVVDEPDPAVQSDQGHTIPQQARRADDGHATHQRQPWTERPRQDGNDCCDTDGYGHPHQNPDLLT